MKFLSTDYSASGVVGHYSIDTDRRIRFEHYQGQTRLDDLKSIQTSMVSDPCWAADFHSLVDLSAAKLDLSSNDILRLALVLRQQEHRTSGWLTYVATDSATYGIVRMLGYWSRTTDRVRIFQSRDEAEAWLALNRDQVPPRFISEKVVRPAAVIRNAG